MPAVTKSAASAIGRDSLVGDPDALRQFSGLPEDVDRHAAARVEVAADPQPMRLEQIRDALADGHRDVLVKGAVVAKRLQIELQRFRLDQPFLRYVVDHQNSEVRLTGHRADGGEFRGSK